MMNMKWPRPSFGAVNIVWNPMALEATEDRLFPASRHRSARIRKKLIKRYGGEFRMKPCIWQVNGQFVAHPSFKAELDREMKKMSARLDNDIANTIRGVY